MAKQDIRKISIHSGGHPNKFDGATIVKDLVDIGELDLDAIVHDYDYINGANRNFIKKWKVDIKYIKNMERNNKGPESLKTK